MAVIRLGLEEGLNVESYLNSGIDWEEMQRIREELESKK